jgi:hypothetical protein
MNNKSWRDTNFEAADHETLVVQLFRNVGFQADIRTVGNRIGVFVFLNNHVATVTEVKFAAAQMEIDEFCRFERRTFFVASKEANRRFKCGVFIEL